MPRFGQGCGVVYKQLGDPRKAIPRYQRAVKIHHALGSRHGEARGLNNLASAHLMLARLNRAEECLRACLPLTDESGDRHLQTLTLVNLALVRQKQARLPEALEALDEALAVAQATGLRYAEAVTYETFGWTWIWCCWAARSSTTAKAGWETRVMRWTGWSASRP